jgi:hypothetical protein
MFAPDEYAALMFTKPCEKYVTKEKLKLSLSKTLWNEDAVVGW